MTNNQTITSNRTPTIKQFSYWLLRFGYSRREAGFTLLEVIVSLGIFFVVIVMAIGAVLAINNAQVKASNVQIIQDNLRFALEFVTKELRAGDNFSTANCSGSPSTCSQINFTHSLAGGGSEDVGFCLRGNTIQRLRNTSDCNLGAAITSDDIIVDRLLFYIVEQASPPLIQPRLTIGIQAHSRDPRLATQFRLQTSIVKRSR